MPAPRSKPELASGAGGADHAAERRDEPAAALRRSCLPRPTRRTAKASSSADSPSYLLHLNGGIVKVTGVQAGRRDRRGARSAAVGRRGCSRASGGSSASACPKSSRQISDREIAYVDGAAGRPASSTPRFNWIFFTRGASREPEMAGILGAVVGSFLTLLVTLGTVVPDRRRRGGLSRGVRPEEPLDRPDRGEHQQSRGGALDRLRPARPCRVPELLRPAALRPARRRHGARADDAADHHHRLARRAEGGAAVDPRGGARRRRLEASRPSSTTCCRSPCPAS